MKRIELTSLFAGVISIALLSPLSTWAEEHAEKQAEEDPHAAVFSIDQFPSATQCSGCHQQIYDEWSSSSHAYAGISPMFHKFEQKISDLAPSIGNFCVRCHMSVSTTLGEARDMPLWERSQVSREGVTCISCHRVSTEYGKSNGERAIVPGTIFSPVYGPFDGEGVDAVVAAPGAFRAATSEEQRGTKIHTKAIKFEQISQSEFCVSCHQVAVNLGIKLEVVWDQYRASPAMKEGVSCQDCHMGSVPGKAEGYDTGAAAEMSGETVNEDRKHSNHAFFGPGYPIAHPGVFPHNPDAQGWTMEEWLQFNYRAGWGTEEFEEKIDNEEISVEFPEVWSDVSDREEAYEVIVANQELIQEKAELRQQVMENGSHLDGPFFGSDLKQGEDLDFHYTVTNTNPGHNLPSGSLGAQPEIWLNVALIDPDGERVWESGYVDDQGDMADQHSAAVLAGQIPHDDQLFNLQTKFLTTNVKGTDREMYLPVNFDIDQIPFLRPPAQPVSVMNHPPFVRMEGRSIPPLGSRDANYSVPSELMTKAGTYKLAVRLRSRAEPMYFMKFVGATSDMEQAMNEWMIDIHPYTVEFEIKE